MPKFALVLVPVLAVLSLPATAEENGPGSEVEKLLKEYDDLFKFDDGPAKAADPAPAWDEKSARSSAEQNFKEAKDATERENWPGASRAAQRAMAGYISLLMIDSAVQRKVDKQILDACQSLLANAAYHLKGGPLYDSK